MAKSTLTLYQKCLIKIICLLRNSYWGANGEDFKQLSSQVIEELIFIVTQVLTSVPLESFHIRPLIASGRVRRFILKLGQRKIKVSAETITEILMDMSAACHYLVTINISLNLPSETRFHAISHALNFLLSAAKKVEYLESDTEFDLQVLCQSLELKRLVLNFDLRNPVYDFLKVGDQFRTNSKLTHLILKYNSMTIESIKLQVDIVLKYCTELVHVNVDIARALQQLHAVELSHGCLKRKYKFQNCRLGSWAASASENEVLIASITCPDIGVLCLVISDKKAISPLSNFHKLHHLGIVWNTEPPTNYNMELQKALKKQDTGRNLSSLRLRNFSYVDFISIGACCPNLEELTLFHFSLRYNHSFILPASLPKLKCLCLHGPDNTISGSEQLADLLRSAVNLRQLSLVYLINLTDHILEVVLRHNFFSKLQTITMYGTGASLDGLRMLASTVQSLRNFRLPQSEVQKEEIREILCEKNPQMQVKFMTYMDIMSSGINQTV